MYLNERFERLNKKPFSTENELQARTKLTNDTNKPFKQTFQTNLSNENELPNENLFPN